MKRWRERWPEAHARWHAAHKRWRHSLRWRLVTLFVVLALATAAVFLVGTQRLVRGGWQGWAKPIAADYIDRLTAEIGTPPDKDRAVAIAARLPITIRIEGPRVRFDSHPNAELGDWHDPQMTSEGWGLVRMTADGHRITFGLSSLPASSRARFVGLATLAALLALTAVAYAVVHRLLAPLASIGAGVARYGRGDFTESIPHKRSDELGELAQRVNGMAKNLQGMLDAKRALLLAISHELRSPLTRARLNAELVNDGDAKTALLRDLSEMRDLITDLLESERIAEGHSALKIEKVDVPALVRELVGARFPGVALQFALDESVGPIQADGTRLKLLLRNMVDNALRHSGGASIVPLVTFTRDPGGQLLLAVRDYGPAVITDEQLARLSEPFYRPDSARTRSTGGVGLGLYLCRLVAEAHGGSLSIGRVTPGLEVAARWPAVTRSA